MSHILILYYIIVALIGCVALPISILGTIRSQIKSYWLLILFYGTFTVMVGVLFVRQYLYVNVEQYSLNTAAVTRMISSLLTIIFMTSITLHFHRLFLNHKSPVRDCIIIALYGLTILLYIWPNAAVIDAERKILIIGKSIQY
jgi:hypothetical protein